MSENITTYEQMPINGNEQQLTVNPEPQGTGIFDMPTTAFKKLTKQRDANWKHLLTWINSTLTPKVDFYTLSFKTKNGGQMESKPTLSKAGAEKICGLLGVTVHFPNLHRYEDAAIEGREIKNVIIGCNLKAGDKVLAESCGARRLAQDNGDLNKTMKMALKSAHIDATLRLAGLSAIFTQDLDDIIKGGEKDITGEGETVTDNRTDNETKPVTQPPVITSAQHKKLEATIADSGKLKGLDGVQTQMFRNRVKDWYFSYSERKYGKGINHLSYALKQDFQKLLDNVPVFLTKFIGELPATDKQLSKLKRLLKQRNIPLEHCKTDGMTRKDCEEMCKRETLDALVNEINSGINQCVNTGEQETPLTPSKQAELEAELEAEAEAKRRSELALARMAEREMDRYFRPPNVYHRASELANALEADRKNGY